MKKYLVCLLILGVVFGTSCKGSTTPEPPPAKQPPVIVSFTVTPSSCLYEVVVIPVLAWNVTGATSVSIDQGIGVVEASGTREVPMKTTTWTLAATNADGAVSKSCTLTVTLPRLPAHFVLVSSTANIYDIPNSLGRPYLEVSGTVQNDGESPEASANVEVWAEMRDANNVSLGRQSIGYPGSDYFVPGQKLYFRFFFFNPGSVAHIAYQITWSTGTTIGTISIEDVTYSVRIRVGVVATFSVVYRWDVFFGTDDTYFDSLSLPNNGERTHEYVKIKLSASSTEKTIPVKWKLVSCAGGSDWAELAIYQYWLQVTPVSPGIVVEPATEQRVGPFTGWKIGDIKQLSFKIKKS